MIKVQDIPFAVMRSTGRLVDINQAPANAGDEMVCPGCGEQLVPKRGEVLKWHFSHTADHVGILCRDALTKALVQMAIQLFVDNISLQLPVFGRTGESHKVVLQNVMPTASIENHPVDVLGTINGFSFGIVLMCSGRKPSSWLEFRPYGKSLGVLGLSLDPIMAAIAAGSLSMVTVLSKLKYYIESSNRGRKWLYHPKMQQPVMGADIEAESTLPTTTRKRMFDNRGDEPVETDYRYMINDDELSRFSSKRMVFNELGRVTRKMQIDSDTLQIELTAKQFRMRCMSSDDNVDEREFEDWERSLDKRLRIVFDTVLRLSRINIDMQKGGLI